MVGELVFRGLRRTKEGSSGGASFCKGFHEGDLQGGLLYWGTRKMRFFLEICKLHCKRASVFIGTLLGNLEGVRLPGLLREKKRIHGFWRPLRF